MCGHLHRPEMGVRSPGAGVVSSQEPICSRFWKPSPATGRVANTFNPREISPVPTCVLLLRVFFTHLKRNDNSAFVVTKHQRAHALPIDSMIEMFLLYLQGSVLGH